jgi:hypothetical protein
VAHGAGGCRRTQRAFARISGSPVLFALLACIVSDHRFGSDPRYERLGPSSPGLLPGRGCGIIGRREVAPSAPDGMRSLKVSIRPLCMGLAGTVAVAIGVLLAVTAGAVAASSATVSPRDNCGGFNGHVVWTSSYVQLYGEVWDTSCPGSSSVWLSWYGPGYNNVNAETVAEPKTAGVNFKTDTPQTPTDIEVAVCSTSGGWHCGTPVAVPEGSPPTTTTSPTTTSPTGTTPPPSSPVVTTPVSTPLPRPASSPRELRVKLAIGWTWNRAHTWLRRVKVASLPGTTKLSLRCEGHGCPRPRRNFADGTKAVHRLLRRIVGRRYRAGDRLLLTLAAPGWLSERAQIRFRWGRLPGITSS